MKLYPEKLAGRLRQGLDPIYLIAGQEPVLIEEACDAVRRAALEAGVTERIVIEADARFDWSQFGQATETGSLFATRRLVEIRLPTGKPGREGGAAIRELAQNSGEDIALIKCDDWEFRSESSAWVKAVENAGVYLPCWKIKAHQLPEWIGRRLASRGLQADRRITTFLAERLEGNLLAAAQEVERLALLFGQGSLSLPAVREAVADSARFDSFRLVELVMTGQPGPAVRCIRGLREADTPMPMVVGALARELQAIAGFQRLTRQMSEAAAFRELGVWKSRQQPLAAAARRMSSGTVRRALAMLSDLDAMSKSNARGEFWVSLERLCVGLATNQPEYCAA